MKNMSLLLSFVLTSIGVVVGSVQNDLTEILKSGISNRVYPGVAAISGSLSGKFIYSGVYGTYEYLDNNSEAFEVNLDKSIFDIASLSKVVATTSAVALLYQKGYLSLSDSVSKHLGEEYNQNNKDNVTVLNCLLHNAGYQPDPNPPYYSPEFACPEPLGEGFTCINSIYSSLLSESLVSPVGTNFVYSDLSFITLQFIVGTIVHKNKLISKDVLRPECIAHIDNLKYDQKVDQSLSSKSGEKKSKSADAYTMNCLFEGYVRTIIFQENRQWLPSTTYLPSPEKYPLILPTVNQTQGHVSDSNCFAMGGVCGHAGIFSTAPDLAKFLTRLLRLTVNEDSSSVEHSFPADPDWLNSTTMKLFTTEYNNSQSSRALGWTTNDPAVNDYGFSGSCGNMSIKTFMHIGYTGTCLCVDPETKLWSLILTNRVYGIPMGDSNAVKAIYKSYHNKLLELVQNKEI